MFILDLKQFENQPKQELSMIEIARAILEENNEQPIAFANLVDEVQKFFGETDEEFETRLSQFYTDLNVDGSFISLGNNVWGLRAWYPVDSIDESIHDMDPDEETATKRKPKKKKANVFADDVDEDDVIDYNDDDPEDDDFDDEEDEDIDVDVEDEEDEEDDFDSATSSLDDNLAELTGGNDLDDLSDGDKEL